MHIYLLEYCFSSVNLFHACFIVLFRKRHPFFYVCNIELCVVQLLLVSSLKFLHWHSVTLSCCDVSLSDWIYYYVNFVFYLSWKANLWYILWNYMDIPLDALEKVQVCVRKIIFCHDICILCRFYPQSLFLKPHRFWLWLNVELL